MSGHTTGPQCEPHCSFVMMLEKIILCIKSLWFSSPAEFKMTIRLLIPLVMFTHNEQSWDETIYKMFLWDRFFKGTHLSSPCIMLYWTRSWSFRSRYEHSFVKPFSVHFKRLDTCDEACDEITLSYKECCKPDSKRTQLSNYWSFSKEN